MNSANDVKNELIEMGSELTDLPRAMPFVVPDLYFTTLVSDLTNRIENEPDAEVTIHGIKMPAYTIPEGYFDNFTEHIMAINAIDGANKANPYSVPVDYFDTLPQAIIEKVTPVAPKSIITANKNRTIGKVNWLHYLKWSIAAALVIGIGYTTYQQFYAPSSVPVEQILASADESEINEYLSHMYREDPETTVGNASLTALPLNNNEIVAYLNETGWD